MIIDQRKKIVDILRLKKSLFIINIKGSMIIDQRKKIVDILRLKKSPTVL
jgi:head-tail adaptor